MHNSPMGRFILFRPVPSFRNRGVLFRENECYLQLNGCGLHIHNLNSCA